MLLIEREELTSLIPHSGNMCLLDGVIEWDEKNIICISNSHKNADNPLRNNGRLAALHAFEYGAQAVAVHGGLLARQFDQTAPPGYLAALRNGKLYVEYLDDIKNSLQVSAKQLMAGEGSYVYQTRVAAEDKVIAEVRVTIMVRPGL